MSDHAHHQWKRTVTNVSEKAVAELLPYKELFTTAVLE